MMSADRLHLELTSELDRLSEVRNLLRSWLPPQGWTDNQTGEIVLAVDEALANVIRHGYQNRGKQRILLDLYKVDDPQHGPGVAIEIRDFGEQIEPADICGRNLDEPRPGGLGVHIMRTTMNDVTYSRADGGGMRLVMHKYKSHTVHPDDRQTGTP